MDSQCVIASNTKIGVKMNLTNFKEFKDMKMIEGLMEELSCYDSYLTIMGSFSAKSRGLGLFSKSSFESNLIR